VLFLCHQQGLRITALVGIVGTCVGAWIKVFSVDPSLFYVSFIGQSIVALAQVCILSLPARLAAVWFGPDQVSSATSVGVFGNQVSGSPLQSKIMALMLCHVSCSNIVL